jgi:hypothetical protein
MNRLWQRLLEYLWPSRIDPAVTHARRMMILQMVIAFAIMVAAGPEIIAAMELTTLLELMGASLFLTAYAAGARLVAISILRAVQGLVLPSAHVSVIRSHAPAGVKALALVLVLVNVVGCLAGAVVLGAYGRHIFELAA